MDRARLATHFFSQVYQVAVHIEEFGRSFEDQCLGEGSQVGIGTTYVNADIIKKRRWPYLYPFPSSSSTCDGDNGHSRSWRD